MHYVHDFFHRMDGLRRKYQRWVIAVQAVQRNSPACRVQYLDGVVIYTDTITANKYNIMDTRIGIMMNNYIIAVIDTGAHAVANCRDCIEFRGITILCRN